MTVTDRSQLPGQQALNTGAAGEPTPPANARSRPSLEAADSQRGRTAAKRRAVKEALHALGVATIEQIAEHLDWHTDSTRPRVNELLRAGAVEQCGRALTRSGRAAQLWRLAGDERGSPPGKRTTPGVGSPEAVSKQSGNTAADRHGNAESPTSPEPTLGELLRQVYDAAPGWLTTKQVDELLGEAVERLGDARAAYVQVRDYLAVALQEST